MLARRTNKGAESNLSRHPQCSLPRLKVWRGSQQLPALLEAFDMEPICLTFWDTFSAIYLNVYLKNKTVKSFNVFIYFKFFRISCLVWIQK